MWLALKPRIDAVFQVKVFVKFQIVLFWWLCWKSEQITSCVVLLTPDQELDKKSVLTAAKYGTHIWVCSTPQNTGHTFATWRNTWPVVSHAFMAFAVCEKGHISVDVDILEMFVLCVIFICRCLCLCICICPLSFIPCSLSSFGTICSLRESLRVFLAGARSPCREVGSGTDKFNDDQRFTTGEHDLRRRGGSFTARTTRQTCHRGTRCCQLECPLGLYCILICVCICICISILYFYDLD